MTNCENHQISIISPNTEDKLIVFNHPLVLIKGHVGNTCENSVVQVNLNGVFDKSIKLDIKGCFKYLFRLTENQSNNTTEVVLKYCNKTEIIFIKYSKSNDQLIKYDVQPLYLINEGHKGDFQIPLDDPQNNDAATACIKINLAMELLQLITAEKLLEAGFQSRKTFKLKTCQIFHSKFTCSTVRSMDEHDLYNLFAKEILLTKGERVCRTTKFVAFISCTQFTGIQNTEDYSYSNIKSKTFGNASLGGGFLCLLGTGCLYTWAENLSDVVSALENEEKVNLSQVMDDSNYRFTHGGCYSTNLGSTLHELGHTFDLGHTNDGLMGKDVDFVRKVFSSKIQTENLPERHVKKCQPITKKDLHSGIMKFTKLKRAGVNFLEKYHQQKNSDLTFFERNCAISLFYHPWFNNSIDEQKDTEIIFNLEKRQLNSKNSHLKIVEARELDSGLLIQYWEFLDDVISLFSIPSTIKLKSVTIFAINDCFTIFKRDFD